MTTTVTLVKTKEVSGAYIGGLGVDRHARYTVKGHEYITIKPTGRGWMARDDKAGKCLALKNTLKEMRLTLAEKLAA